MSEILTKLSKILFIAAFLIFGLTGISLSQDVDPALYENMKWRDLGFSRGGRSTASTGIANDPLTYYMGTTGGGL